MSTLEQQAFIADIPPFDRLQEDELVTVAKAMDIAYFQEGDQPIVRGKAPLALYIIIKGVVQETNADEEVISLSGSQDSFDAISLLEGKSKSTFTVKEELICYTLPKPIFDELLQSNSNFQSFYYQNISKRVNELIERRNNKDLASFMVAKVHEAYIHTPVMVDSENSVYDAVKEMKTNKGNSMLVQRGDEVGIVTDKDLSDHLVLNRYSIDAPIGDIATYNLLGVQREDFLFNALLMMTRYTIKRVVVYDKEKVVGVLDQIDLLSYLSNHSHLVTVQVDRAKTIEQLKVASKNLLSMIKALHSQGMKVRYITKLVNELNQKIFRKLYSFIAPNDLLENSCLIIMGSEGRGEQILKTDQDNAIIVRDDFEYDYLREVAAQFSDTLKEFGYPKCKGNIMVSNPYWFKHLKDYKDEIYRWIQHPAEESMMNMAIFYDAVAVAGDPELLNETKAYLYKKLQDNHAFFAHFAKPTLAFETPLTMFANFIVEKSHHKNELDIKKGGIFPIVHGIRSLALEHRISQTNTIERLKILSNQGVLEKQFAIELVEAFAFMVSIRLQFELEEVNSAKEHDNYINPSKLNKLERDLLKDSLKIVDEFKKYINYHFKLNTAS